MKGAAGTVIFFVVAGIVVATEPDAPLANTSKELKKLRQEQAEPDNSASAAKNHLTEGLPDFQPAIPGLLTLDPATAGKSPNDLKKKKDLQKNWLIDGVNKLEQEGKVKDGKAVAPPETSAAEKEAKENLKPDSGDSNYLLKLYDEQQKNTESKVVDNPSAAAHPDAFAPFMHEWLGSSPVRGKFFDEFVKPADSSGSVVAASGGPATAINPVADLALPSRDTHPLAAPNPYLAGLDLPPPSSFGDGRPGGPAADLLGKPAEIVAPPAAESWPLTPAPERKNSVPPPLDDKKYFPQLKKF